MATRDLCMNDHSAPSRKSRGRLVTGLVILSVGAILLAVNLGLRLPTGWYTYWPWLLVVIGTAQIAWPGSARDRLIGFWPIAVGAWGLISMYEVFGLTWSKSWPLFVIAAGLRVVLGSIFRESNRSTQ
jgi:hypothetical protein